MPSIIIRQDGKPAREVVLEKAFILIGRTAAADIKIDDPNAPEECASILQVAEKFILDQLGPTSGILVNGQPVKKQVLKDRDLITIAEYRMTFQDKREEDKPVGVEEELARIQPRLQPSRQTIKSVDPFRSAPGGMSKLVIYLVLAAVVAGIGFASFQSYQERQEADAQAALQKKAYDDKAKSEAEKMQDNARAVASSIKPQ